MAALTGLLETYNSVRLNQTAHTWEEAVRESVKPLVEAGAVLPEYADMIIESTHTLGPYYILCPYVAMPHAQVGSHIKADSFSFVTLDKPVTFPDGREVLILICMAATSTTSVPPEALMQLSDVFTNEGSVEQVCACKDSASLLRLIDQYSTDQHDTGHR